MKKFEAELHTDANESAKSWHPWTLFRFATLFVTLAMMFTLIGATPAEIAAIKAEIKSYKDAIEDATPVITEFYVSQLSENNPKWSPQKVASKANAAAKVDIKTLINNLLDKQQVREIELIRKNMRASNVLNVTRANMSSADQATVTKVAVVIVKKSTGLSLTQLETVPTGKPACDRFSEMEMLDTVREIVMSDPLNLAVIYNQFQYLIDNGMSAKEAFSLIIWMAGDGLMAMQVAYSEIAELLVLVAAELQPYVGVVILCIVVAGIAYYLTSKPAANDDINDADVIIMSNLPSNGNDVIHYHSDKNENGGITVTVQYR